VRRSQSAWGFVSDDVEAAAMARLGRDLEDGTWHARHGHLLDQPVFDGSLRLVVASPSRGVHTAARVRGLGSVGT
jgi:hypothetical protein